MELVASALSDEGFHAGANDTGGGIVCVVLQRENGGQIVWGTADVTWGASVINADGDVESSIETKCPSSTQDIALVVETLERPSTPARSRNKAVNTHHAPPPRHGRPQVRIPYLVFSRSHFELLRLALRQVCPHQRVRIPRQP